MRKRRWRDDFIYGMVTNTVSVGGFKTIRPDGVALDDGLYEVLLIYPVENPMELQWLANDLLTHNIESEPLRVLPHVKNQFSSDDEVTWTLDGEIPAVHCTMCRLPTAAVRSHLPPARSRKAKNHKKSPAECGLNRDKERMQPYYG